jgi:hypothetical protein
LYFFLDEPPDEAMEVARFADPIEPMIDALESTAKGEYGAAVVGGVLAATRLNKVKKFTGGAFGKLQRAFGLERHHIPADSVSPLSRARGPAIQMESADHAMTSSYGNSAAARAFRDNIQQLIGQGKWREAAATEIRDVRRVAGAKYNEAVQEMLEYMRSIGLIE